MDTTRIVELVRKHFPATQAVYLYGSRARGEERADSDLDLAVLLPPAGTGDDETAVAGALALEELRGALEVATGLVVDLVSLRAVSTVLQKEVVTGGLRVFAGDTRAAAEFEMLTLSYYQKLNEERREILEAFRKTGRAVPL